LVAVDAKIDVVHLLKRVTPGALWLRAELTHAHKCAG
jgi:hypothetical protein